MTWLRFGFWILTLGWILLNPLTTFAQEPLDTCDSIEGFVAGNCKTERKNSDHSCEWVGLTYQCIDTTQTICELKSGGECISDPGSPQKGHYQIADAVAQFVRLAQWGLGFVVVLAVLMFVWAGWQFITAGGRADKVEEGKRIIGGTITGIIVSFAAYVIVNFSVIALTGETQQSRNVLLGPIGVLFPNDPALRRPFSEDNSSALSNNCRSPINTRWTKGCSNQIYCADPGEDIGGDVWFIQDALNQRNCSCGTADGCFGPQTVDCVRRFQIANDLPPSGTVDAKTSKFIFDGASKSCDDAGTQADAVMSNLPKAVYPDLDPFQANNPDVSLYNDPTVTGCCIVSDDQDPLYCLENVSFRNCKALDGRGKNDFIKDKRCTGTVTNNRCGYCQTSELYAAGGSNSCFEFATPRWCASYARDADDADPLVFHPSTCQFTCPAVGAACRGTILINPR